MISIADMRKIARWPMLKARRVFGGERIARVLSRFESLGDSCEFGLLQRRWGVDQMGLFRFAGGDLASVCEALDDRLAAFSRDDALDFHVAPNTGEWIVHVAAYHLVVHTWVNEHVQAREAMATDQTTKLRYQARRFLEDLEDGEKIFVFRARYDYEPAQIESLAAALRRDGPNTLLWVDVARTPDEAGQLVVAGEGLLRARISRLAPDENAHNADDLAWIDLCQRALRLRETIRAREATP
jgi:hypothetical protein